MPLNRAQIREIVRDVISQLVAGNYDALEQRTGGTRLSAEEMREAVAEYGRQLRMPPTEALEDMVIVDITAPGPAAWSVVSDLWTEEEGRSDLSLELTLREEKHGITIEIDNIHVL
jgi:hypothetical protein